MALSRVKNWVPLEVLTASDLNGEINNIINNGLALISPLTGNLDFNFQQATNMRLEVQTATQTAAQGSGRIYWQSSEGAVHIDTGSLIARTPAITAIREGRLVGTLNTSGISGATTYGLISIATSGDNSSLSLTSGVLSATPPTAPYEVRGLVGVQNASVLKYDLTSCISAQLWNASNYAAKIFNAIASKTVDLGTTGPAANCRDQASAFSANSFVHLYYIGATDGTIDAIASANGPTTGPALPTGYTHWAYATTLRINAGSNLYYSVTRGSTQAYASGFAVLTTGTATTETAVSLSSAVPSQALATYLDVKGRQTVLSATGPITATIRHSSGALFNFDTLEINVGSGALDSNGKQLRIPNVGQNLYYLWSTTSGTPQLDLLVQGYTVPNGDS